MFVFDKMNCLFFVAWKLILLFLFCIYIYIFFFFDTQKHQMVNKPATTCTKQFADADLTDSHTQPLHLNKPMSNMRHWWLKTFPIMEAIFREGWLWQHNTNTSLTSSVWRLCLEFHKHVIYLAPPMGTQRVSLVMMDTAKSHVGDNCLYWGYLQMTTYIFIIHYWIFMLLK